MFADSKICVCSGSEKSDQGLRYFNYSLSKFSENKNPNELSVLGRFVDTDNSVYNNIVEITKEAVSGRPLYKIAIENPVGKRYDILGDEKATIYSIGRGFIPFSKVNDMDVFLDEEGRLCKLIYMRRIHENNYTTKDMFQLSVSFTNNFYCNGVLVA